ncbi:MAG: flagellar biosynthesis protein FlgB [Pseudomonadota bacterium]
MAISFDKALGIHEAALRIRTQRAEVLASNLANVETPGYQARDIDFREMLQQQQAARQSTLPLQGNESTLASRPGTTHARHIALGQTSHEYGTAPEVKFTQPLQGALDDNTVDAHQEHAKFMQNAMDFQASFTLLNKKFT